MICSYFCAGEAPLGRSRHCSARRRVPQLRLISRSAFEGAIATSKSLAALAVVQLIYYFQSGGVIELMPENVVGCPGANVFVHPSGHVELRSTFDSLRRYFNAFLILQFELDIS